MQHDVIAMIDRFGDTVVKYIYDSWGKVEKIEDTMAGTLGERNPFRYRGDCPKTQAVSLPVPTFDRCQMMYCSWDSFVAPDSIARLIDAFVNSLDSSGLGVKKVAPSGRPQYNLRGMYKLYIYGNRKGIRSSRKLADSCKVNIEVKWMTGGVEPDFRTISDFRKDNIDSLKKIFHEFNRRIAGSVDWGYYRWQ